MIYNILLGLIFIISSYAIWSGKVWGWYFATAFYIKTLLRIGVYATTVSVVVVHFFLIKIYVLAGVCIEC